MRNHVFWAGVREASPNAPRMSDTQAGRSLVRRVVPAIWGRNHPQSSCVRQNWLHSSEYSYLGSAHQPNRALQVSSPGRTLSPGAMNSACAGMNEGGCFSPSCRCLQLPLQRRSVLPTMCRQTGFRRYSRKQDPSPDVVLPLLYGFQCFGEFFR